MGRTAVSVGVVGALVAGLGAVQLLPGDTPLSAPPAAAAGLQSYGGCAELLQDYRSELRRTATAYGWEGGGGLRVEMQLSARGDAQTAASGVAAAPAVGTGPTGTNVQEAGVDEPDVAKLSGDLLVTVGDGGLNVLRAGAAPTRLGRLALDADGAGRAELLLDGTRALVVLPEPAYGIAEGGAASDVVDGVAPRRPAPVQVSAPRTTLRLADLSDPAAPRWLERWRVDGDYVSARLVDGTVRLVTRSLPRLRPASPYGLFGRDRSDGALQDNREAAGKVTLEEVLPAAERTDASGAVVSRGPALRCEQVRTAGGTTGAGMLLVTTLRPGSGLEPLDSVGVRADGDLVYAGADRLVVATSRWGTAAGSGTTSRVSPEVTTELHTFDTSDPDTTRHVATGSVPGYVYGRWALSQHEGALRVATTTAPPWSGGAGSGSASRVTVLRERGRELVRAGAVTGLGKGEQIKSVRYLGDLAAVVTFRQTDPLYVLDLADPDAPRLLGELKVPGYSAYLHPVGDDRLLGIGMEADPDGRTTGLQASLFDLSDRGRPTQLDRLALQGDYSEALDDSRAFGYDPARRLAVLPLGGYDGRSVAGGITVGQDGQLREAGRLAVPAGAQLRRVLSDGEHLYAVTTDGVVAAEPGTLRRTGGLTYR